MVTSNLKIKPYCILLRGFFLKINDNKKIFDDAKFQLQGFLHKHKRISVNEKE